MKQPEGFRIELPFSPLVESWDRHDHPSQVRLRSYTVAIAELSTPALRRLSAPYALGFHVAGRADIGAGCDLDNFLTPAVRALGGARLFSYVWATRGRPEEVAALTLVPATAARCDVLEPASRATVELDVSPERREWKERIAGRLGVHESAQETGPVELALRFHVSPKRNWMSLWKPTIDALGGILGQGHRPWSPRDDRIALLILERVADAQRNWNVGIDMAWCRGR